MYKVPLPEIKEKIVNSGKLSAKELETRIKAKINDLSGLISEEGAAHIIANELGVEIVSAGKEKLKIKEIYAGMRSVTTVGKVMKKFDVRQFTKGTGTGRVCSIVLGDDTGTVRLVFWNDQVDLTQTIKEDDIIHIKNAYVRDNNGNVEIHCNEHSDVLINPQGESIGVVRQGGSYHRKKIGELQDGEDGAEILGTVVQVFDPRFFYVCPDCNKRVVESQGSFQCAEHGAVKASLSYVLNAMMDDGTSTIRGVFWKNQTHHLLQKSEEQMVQFKDNASSFEEIKTDLLGEQFKLIGRVKRNEMFDRLEFNVQIVEKANPEAEIARLQAKQ